MRLPTCSRRWLSVTGSLLPLTALLAPVASAATMTPPAPCPPAAQALLDGLYRWQVARQNDTGPMVLISQRQRFTPELYSRLVRAAALRPGQGGFLDFDVFSGTQVRTFGATVQGCTRQGPTSLLASVAVQAGLRGRTAEPPQQLRYTLQQDNAGNWRIAEITYLPRDPETTPYTLSTILTELLDSTSPTPP